MNSGRCFKNYYEHSYILCTQITKINNLKKQNEMKKIILEFILFLITFSLNAQQVEKSSSLIYTSEVKTTSGILRGFTEGEVSIFKGIRYAAPPVGEYRWRPPQSVVPWEGIFDATEYGSNCAQAGWPRGSGTIAEGSSEDCLYLNLWIPKETKKGSNLPVMVWIHGGGFVGGSGSGQLTDGSAFAKQGIILITFNYRLGRLGHFAFPALSIENPEEPKGSYAYMDMIAALKWVNENISTFGGDPNNITIFGESAGGVAVHSLLSIPSANGLFHKAIIESGGGRDGVLTWRPISKENADPYYPVSAETIGINFALKHGIDGTDAVALAKLRALSVEEIVDGGQESNDQGSVAIYSGPILDGKMVVETAEVCYENGRQKRVPIIIGSNSAEVSAGFVNANSKEELKNLFGNLREEMNAVYDPNGKVELAEMLTMVNTDKVWAEPARFTAKAWASTGDSAYVYLFSYVPESIQERLLFGAPHGSEIAYVFNNLNARWGIDEISDKDKEVSQIMNTYWVNFAKTGNPNGEGVPYWPVYDISKNEIMEFQRDGKSISKPDPKKERLDVIEKAVEANEKF